MKVPNHRSKKLREHEVLPSPSIKLPYTQIYYVDITENRRQREILKAIGSGRGGKSHMCFYTTKVRITIYFLLEIM